MVGGGAEADADAGVVIGVVIGWAECGDDALVVVFVGEEGGRAFVHACFAVGIAERGHRVVGALTYAVGSGIVSVGVGGTLEDTAGGLSEVTFFDVAVLDACTGKGVGKGAVEAGGDASAVAIEADLAIDVREKWAFIDTEVD